MSTPPSWSSPDQQPQSGPPSAYPQGWPQPGQSQPGYPQSYPPVPPPAPTTKRIPEDQPFVARPNIAKRVGLISAVVGAVLLPILCCVGFAIAQAGSAGSAVGITVVIAVISLLGLVLPLGLQIWLLASGGPVLALGPDGLWIRSRPTRGQAVWLPWEAVAQISRRRWSLEKMLVVQPHDPRTLQNLGAYTAFDSGLLKAFYGSGLVATLNFADRSEAEILAAVQYYSAGRCPLR
ncbi:MULTISPECIES: hypothetical protein [Micromonospora]|uniref:PH domain-containing protein n=1 Tax=Micromonospora yangpuensis TaxID=683228 RepID=A0A1C6U6E5_9ACTN|nr:hypothetical protein [Micromonospora yangpuensis]GGL90753.1 hypothetical protein GCM10012279_05660 [Micromonospora yangpuensis]SCL49665.1 hypothetical protein GA0070617_1249 [Micromonospora yangpuensis]